MSKKIYSYVGFAIKAKKILLGVDNILTSKKRVHIILFDASLSDNSAKKIKNYAVNKNIIIAEYCLETLLPKRNCKAIAILDKNLALGIIKELEGELVNDSK